MSGFVGLGTISIEMASVELILYFITIVQYEEYCSSSSNAYCGNLYCGQSFLETIFIPFERIVSSIRMLMPL